MLDCPSSSPDADGAGDCLEVSVLEAMVRKRLYEGEPVTRIWRELPTQQLKNFLPVDSQAQEYRQSQVLLRKGFLLIINQVGLFKPWSVPIHHLL